VAVTVGVERAVGKSAFGKTAPPLGELGTKGPNGARASGTVGDTGATEALIDADDV
jgi:hypothetical protein